MAHAALEQGVIVLVVQLIKLGLGHSVGTAACRNDGFDISVSEVSYLHQILEVADLICQRVMLLSQLLQFLRVV